MGVDLSITDGAPRTITMACGSVVRVPSPMDYRILMRVVDVMGEEVGDIETAALMLFCCLHASRKEIRQLWQMARKPAALFEAMIEWMAQQDLESFQAACDEIQSFDAEREELVGGGDDVDDGKKKTGSR